MADEFDKLVEEFRKLGVPRPESWASSQVKEGIPQLQRARVLYNLWATVVAHSDLGWIEKAREQFSLSEARLPGLGQVSAPHVPVIDRMLNAGISADDLTTLVREMQTTLLFANCVFLDGSSGSQPEADGTCVGLFEVDAENRPVRPIQALHESFFRFDHELETRKAAGPKRNAH